ncbi:Crp/Fnr family transcriptional regulator [Ekhidna sp.]|uniref:Crp/Fnr family transcriptional regulator n=1 Tax=Ekhidna sp. TaxID=2608089 RepID=UPI003299177E
MKVDIKKFDFESNRILSSLSKSEQELFIAHGDTLIFKRNKLVFYEGGIPTGDFLIENGRAKIYKTGLDGKDQIFYIYKTGDLLGYHALLCNEHYEDSCEALEDCKILFISKSNFKSLIKKIPHLSQLLIQNMSHEFGVLVNTITILAQKPLRERLALYLLILNKKYVEQGGDIMLPREDLANIIGTARESLGRLLKEFKEEKLIEVDNKIIRVNNHDKLLKIASSVYH